VMRIGTWNVRSMNQGKLDIVKREMERTGVHMMGVSEMKWTGMGHFKTDDYELKRCVLGFNTISDRVITIRIQCKPVNMTVIQIYALTSTAEDEEIEHVYEMVQKVVDETPKGDVLHVIRDWNAKVGDEETTGTTRRFGLGERNERGDRLVEFCNLNGFVIMNTFFKLQARRLYTWRSPDKVTRNQIDYIMCTTRWRSSVRRVTTLPGADCGT
ncbi:Craniofacial development protein 2, partial [Lamellibrachia satsuma]